MWHLQYVEVYVCRKFVLSAPREVTETSVCLQNKTKEKLKTPPKNSKKKRNEINTQSQDKVIVETIL